MKTESEPAQASASGGQRVWDDAEAGLRRLLECYEEVLALQPEAERG